MQTAYAATLSSLLIFVIGQIYHFHEAASLLQETFPYYAIPDSTWHETADLQRELADKGWHQCASPVDLLVAVTARHHKLTVLHADGDFETISRLTGQSVRWIK
ncbi:PIN domain-containing protein [Nonomuraea glycinis]|uniref:PIN domain-containing protein n=1 Tax=Nonomuraea glycinis TaxID=2047744 RepID=UPI002E134F33|nr:PIN domain-containing protein [Nonomuraea glycinis]